MYIIYIYVLYIYYTYIYSVYVDAVLVNGRDGAIRCSICINIYLASLRRVFREMEARLPSSPTCLPVPRSRYAGFPREDVPLVLRTGLPFELQTVPSPPRLLCPLARSPYPLPSCSRQSRLTHGGPGGTRALARSIGRYNKKSKRQGDIVCKINPASRAQADAARGSAFSRSSFMRHPEKYLGNYERSVFRIQFNKCLKRFYRRYILRALLIGIKKTTKNK